jgi:hypothetical protein
MSLTVRLLLLLCLQYLYCRRVPQLRTHVQGTGYAEGSATYGDSTGILFVARELKRYDTRNYYYLSHTALSDKCSHLRTDHTTLVFMLTG